MLQQSLCILGILLSLPLVAHAQARPPAAADDAAMVCGNQANSAHECAAQVRKSIGSADTLDELTRLSVLWNDRYESEVVKLRSGSVGLVKAKSDMQLIREAISGEVEGLITDKVKSEIAKKTIPATWREAWDTFWSRYFKRVSVFLNHPAAKTTLLALEATMPSQTATDFDELTLSSQGVNDLLWQRARMIDPPPSFLDTVRSSAYQAANQKLSTQLTVGPQLNKP